MAGYDNIKDANANRTPGERRELAKRAGKTSGEVRRRKANFRKTLNLLLTTEVNTDMTPALEALGVDSTLESAMLMSMIKAALEGDVKAANFVAQYAGQSGQTEADEEEQRIRTERAKRARDQEVGDNTGAEENIQSFLKAMNPTQEELDALFADGEEEDANDAKEAEEAVDI